MSAAGSARPGSVQQGLKEALIETLTAILSPVQEVRAAAEEQIKVLEVTEGEWQPGSEQRIEKLTGVLSLINSTGASASRPVREQLTAAVIGANFVTKLAVITLAERLSWLPGANIRPHFQELVMIKMIMMMIFDWGSRLAGCFAQAIGSDSRMCHKCGQ